MRFYWDRNALGVAYGKEDENSHYCSEWNEKVLGILQTSVLLVHLSIARHSTQARALSLVLAD